MSASRTVQAAIRRAIAMAEPGDVVLIAGKGHETYQMSARRNTILMIEKSPVRQFWPAA